MWLVSKKKKKKDEKNPPIWLPFRCGKADVTTCFETIFPTKTPSKLNKIDSVGFIVPRSFVFSRHCLCLCHGNRGVICLYRPFYNNVPFLTKQQRKYQVKPLPPYLMIGSIRSPCFRWIARMSPCKFCVQFRMKISVVSECVHFILNTFLFLKCYRKRGFLFMFKMLESSISHCWQKH